MDAAAETQWLENRLKERTGVDIKLVQTDENGDVTYKGKPYMVSFSGEKATKRECALVQLILSDTEEGVPHEKYESLKNILLGEKGLAVFRFMTRYHIPESRCYVLAVVCEKRLEEAKGHIEKCLDGPNDFVFCMDDRHICVIKFSFGEQTPYEFAQFLSQSLYEELGIHAKIGVGGEEKSFSDVSRSYQQAVTAVRMSSNFRSKGDVHLYREFLLVRMLEELPKARLQEYFAQFDVTGAEDVFNDEELLDTAQQFLECNLNVSETSRNLFMHRNTLTYRLDKIESATGLDIRNFSDAVTFRIISIIYKLLNL